MGNSLVKMSKAISAAVYFNGPSLKNEDLFMLKTSKESIKSFRESVDHPYFE